jgi:predicted phosphodiesterase
MWAIISDIHGNLEAFTAVLADIARQPIERIVCLGDIVGYGPNPCECLDLVRKHSALTIRGNHDHAAMFDSEGFSPSAERAIFWTRDILEHGSGSTRDQRAERWNYLADLNAFHREGDLLFVHGSARNPTNEYVFPEDVYNQRKMERIFALVDKYCFQGHTHVPGIFIEQKANELYQFTGPEEIEYLHILDGRKTLCNVGSVGQPRDGDPRACYVLIENDTIRYRRVEYEIHATRKKIYAIPELENFLGDRLLDGR